MNRRNVINANTDRSRIAGWRRNASFGTAFGPTARDLGLQATSKDGGEELLPLGPDDEQDES